MRIVPPTRHRRVAVLGLLAAAAAVLLAAPAHAARTGRLNPPVVAFAGASQTSIDLSVCGGALTGAPAGFTVQWMTAAQYVANGNTWYLPGDPRLCSASFAGAASGVDYDLAAGECVVVNVGDRLFDEGAASNCMLPQRCGTGFVFRAFAHPAGLDRRSAYTGNRDCPNHPCGHLENCTHSQGYWKTHFEEWPVTTLELGTVSYADLELLAIFEEPAAGNGLISLAHQLIAAKLNVAAGADPTLIAGAIAEADLLIGALVVPPVGGGYLEPAVTGALTDLLASWNEGVIGPGNCDEGHQHCHHHCHGGHCGPH